jgi:hypothetical protein
LEPDSDFRGQLEARIRRFAKQRDDLRNQLVELNHALNAIEKRLETAVEMYQLEFDADPPGESAIKQSSSPRLRTSGGSWNETVEAVLADAETPLHIRDIWSRVQQRGFTSSAKDPLRAIAAVLVRHPNAVRTGPNTYALAGTNGAPVGGQQTLVPADETPLSSPREDT